MDIKIFKVPSKEEARQLLKWRKDSWREMKSRSIGYWSRNSDHYETLMRAREQVLGLVKAYIEVNGFQF